MWSVKFINVNDALISEPSLFTFSSFPKHVANDFNEIHYAYTFDIITFHCYTSALYNKLGAYSFLRIGG